MSIRVEPAIISDAVRLAPHLRKEDLAEIAAHSGDNPTFVLVRGVKEGKAWTGFDDDGNIIGIFGVASNKINPRIGHPWLLASERLVDNQRAFIRLCKPWARTLEQDHDLLLNYVDVRNRVHIKWLKWCGFRFTRCVRNFGVEKRSFHEFVKECDEAVSAKS